MDDQDKQITVEIVKMLIPVMAVVCLLYAFTYI